MRLDGRICTFVNGCRSILHCSTGLRRTHDEAGDCYPPSVATAACRPARRTFVHSAEEPATRSTAAVRERSIARTEGCVVTPGLRIDIKGVYARKIGKNAGRVAQRLPMAAKLLPNSTDCNCLAVRQAARYITQFYDRCLAAVGLRTTQYGVLSRLKRQGPMSINTLAAELVVDRTTLGRNIRPLERDGLIAIASDPTDLRSKILHLTKAGEARFRRAEKHWVEAQKRFEQVYGGRQASKLRENLRAVIASELDPFDTMAAE